MEKNKFNFTVFALFAIVILFTTGLVSAQSAVNLRTAEDFVILSKTGISTTGVTAITGNIGVSPIDSTAITGFDLIADSSTTFSTSSLVTGKIYAADYTSPASTIMTTAISDMETAYTDAAGRTETNIVTELGAGDISGKTIAPGLYKWGTGVLITTDVTLSGNANDVWIFQIAQDLTIGSGAKIILSGGAQAKNIFWQVAGGTGVEIGTTAHMEGNILAAKAIHLRTGATLNGRALSQTAVTLDANTISLLVNDEISIPVVITVPVDYSTSSSGNDGTSGSGTHINVSTNGIGQNLSLQLVERRTNYSAGNFTTSLGNFLNVREISSGLREFREGNVSVRTKLNLTKVENNGSRLEVKLSNGRNAEIKIMPVRASEIALAILKLKFCNETNNCTIELKEVGNRTVYNLHAQKNVKVFGLFRAKMNVETNVDAENGKVISEIKPWWGKFAREAQA
jgi:hypothetical protein